MPIGNQTPPRCRLRWRQTWPVRYGPLPWITQSFLRPSSPISRNTLTTTAYNRASIRRSVGVLVGEWMKLLVHQGKVKHRGGAEGRRRSVGRESYAVRRGFIGATALRSETSDGPHPTLKRP